MRGSASGELMVRWEADDDNLEPRPISLFYSSRPAGPWTTIATNLENVGEYTWPLERHVPRRFYLKLEARDTAGNVAAFQTSEPVVVEQRARPSRSSASGCRRVELNACDRYPSAAMADILWVRLDGLTYAWPKRAAQNRRSSPRRHFSPARTSIRPGRSAPSSATKHFSSAKCSPHSATRCSAAMRTSSRSPRSPAAAASRSATCSTRWPRCRSSAAAGGWSSSRKPTTLSARIARELEDYVAKPHRSGVLVLDVKTWPSTTRLAKAVAASGLTIECKSLNEPQTKRWLAERAKSRYDVRLDASAADALLELLPPELGILDQELAKLSLLVGKAGAIDATLVSDNVGGWRTRTTWDMVDAAADGRAAEAIEQLGRLIAAGEKPQGLLPQMSHSLRQLAAATRLIEAAEAAGSRLSLAIRARTSRRPALQTRHRRTPAPPTRPRAGKQLTGWLLAADLAVKGHNSADARARLELERLIVRLSAANSSRHRPPPARRRDAV